MNHTSVLGPFVSSVSGLGDGQVAGFLLRYWYPQCSCLFFITQDQLVRSVTLSKMIGMPSVCAVQCVGHEPFLGSGYLHWD